MEIEQKEAVETEVAAEETEETSEETTDSTEVKLTDEEKLARLEGGAKRLRKKLGLEEPIAKKEEVKKVENKKSDDTDYAQEAYLTAYGIKEADERELLKERMTATGQSLKDVVGNKYFQQDLEGLREAKATKAAVPPGSNRSGPSARDTVEYWKAKIASGKAKLDDVQDTQLRRDIVNSNLKQAKDVSHFTSNPFGTIDITK